MSMYQYAGSGPSNGLDPDGTAVIFFEGAVKKVAGLPQASWDLSKMLERLTGQIGGLGDYYYGRHRRKSVWQDGSWNNTHQQRANAAAALAYVIKSSEKGEPNIIIAHSTGTGTALNLLEKVKRRQHKWLPCLKVCAVIAFNGTASSGHWSFGDTLKKTLEGTWTNHWHPEDELMGVSEFLWNADGYLGKPIGAGAEPGGHGGKFVNVSLRDDMNPEGRKQYERKQNEKYGDMHKLHHTKYLSEQMFEAALRTAADACKAIRRVPSKKL